MAFNLLSPTFFSAVYQTQTYTQFFDGIVAGAYKRQMSGNGNVDGGGYVKYFSKVVVGNLCVCVYVK